VGGGELKADLISTRSSYDDTDQDIPHFGERKVDFMSGLLWAAGRLHHDETSSGTQPMVRERADQWRYRGVWSR
jgi:hypothetical protein